MSSFRPHDWKLLQSAMHTPLCTNQIEISLQSHDAITNGNISFLQRRGISPMAWSPLGGGGVYRSGNEDMNRVLDRIALAGGRDRAAVAVAWLLAHPARILPVMGTNRIDRIAALTDALTVEMDRQTWFELYTAALGREVP